MKKKILEKKMLKKKILDKKILEKKFERKKLCLLMLYKKGFYTFFRKIDILAANRRQKLTFCISIAIVYIGIHNVNFRWRFAAKISILRKNV